MIAKNPALATRRSTDLRDRFRNAFPDLYEKAGYKPRPTRPIKNKRTLDELDSTFHHGSSGLLKASSRLANGHREGSEGKSGGIKNLLGETSTSQTQYLSNSPEENDVFEDSGCILNDVQKYSRMDTDDDDHEEDVFKDNTSHSNPNYNEGANLRPSLVPIPSSSSDGSVVPSRQRSPSNARNQNASANANANANGEATNPEYLSPNVDHHAHLRQSPGNHGQQHIPLQHPSFGFGDSSWYPARWLSGSQRYGDEMADPSNANNPHLTGHGQLQAPVAMPDFGNSNPVGLSSGNLGMLGLGLGAGGWSNQQTIIDRYDLPSSSQHFLLHGGEFQSEAAIGDTGSSLSGLDEFGTSLSLSSHHR